MQKDQEFQIAQVNQENIDNQDQNIMTTIPPHVNPPAPSNLSASIKKNYSPLEWNQFFDEMYYLDNGTSVFTAGKEEILIFCIHGAGHSALSFARLAGQAKQFGTVVAFDLKGHGNSQNTTNLQDFTIETLCNQTIQIFKQIQQKHSEKNIIMVGHSLGGSICSRVVDTLCNSQKDKKIQGAIIIDVVEGTAIQALPYMNQILNNRPKSFDSLQDAIKWSIVSGTLNKLQSARVSIPSQLVGYEANGLKYYTWKFDLKQTQKFWIGWFKGLSNSFLKIPVPKVLVTAQKERLDKQLTIAQMQGKFKLTILYNVGHSVQEDDYKGFAATLHEFIKDFRIPLNQSELNQRDTIGLAKFHPKLKQYHRIH